MANLSDLLSSATASTPGGWIAQLAAAGAFRDEIVGGNANTPDGWPASGAPDPHTAALADAYAEGRAAGLAEATADHAAALAARDRLALSFARLDDAATLALREKLAETVTQLCAQLIEPALLAPEMITRRCAALAEQIGEAPGTLVLRLNPADRDLLPGGDLPGWTIRPDPDLPRGTLQLESSAGVLADGPDEWRRLIAAALGG